MNRDKHQDWQIVKYDAEQGIAFGWFNVALRKDGKPLIDLQDDTIPPASLEKAAYEFMASWRGANDNHNRPLRARVVESFVVTPEKLVAMGLPADAIPPGRWWGGVQLLNEADRELIKSGARAGFSVEGRARRRVLTEKD